MSKHILKKVGIRFLHVFGWVIFFLDDINMMVTSEDIDFTFVTISISGFLCLIATFYFCYYWVWPFFIKRKKYWQLIFGVVIGSIFYMVFRYFLQEMLMPLFFGFSNYTIDLTLWFYISDNFWRPFQVISLSAILFLLLDRIKTEKQIQVHQSKKKEAQLAMLRSQLNPHFLFNMLSYLHTKAFMLDEKLAETVLQLSDLLRYATQNSEAKNVALSEEIRHLENYIQLIVKRFGENCFVDYQLEGKTSSMQIEPLLFLPFVENAFKHGIYTNEATPIIISIKLDERRVHFSCKNKIAHHTKDKGSGIGLENVRQRLNLRYPDKFELKIDETEDWFTVALTLKEL